MTVTRVLLRYMRRRPFELTHCVIRRLQLMFVYIDVIIIIIIIIIIGIIINVIIVMIVITTIMINILIIIIINNFMLNAVIIGCKRMERHQGDFMINNKFYGIITVI
jgi:hypothetical protein